MLFTEQVTATAMPVVDPPAVTCPAVAALVVEPPTVTIPIVRLILADEGAVSHWLFKLVEVADKPITRAMSKPLVNEFIMHVKSWVHQKRGKNTAV